MPFILIGLGAIGIKNNSSNRRYLGCGWRIYADWQTGWNLRSIACNRVNLLGISMFKGRRRV